MIFSLAPRPRFTAVSASNTILPDAAPGEAPMPCEAGATFCLGSNCGNIICSSDSGSIRSRAFSRLIRPSLAISTELRTMACAFILPLRVCKQ